jgi:hypothetical protein
VRDPVMTQLRHAVRGEIAQAFEGAGYARPRDIARQVCATFPDEIRTVGHRLAEDALTDLARSLLKQSTRHALAAAQLQLPGLDLPVTGALPDVISIPAEGDAGDEDGVTYKPLSRATVRDLEAHLALLGVQIAADTRRHRALKELRDLALAMGATPDSLVLATAHPQRPPVAAAA